MAGIVRYPPSLPRMDGDCFGMVVVGADEVSVFARLSGVRVRPTVTPGNPAPTESEQVAWQVQAGPLVASHSPVVDAARVKWFPASHATPPVPRENHVARILARVCAVSHSTPPLLAEQGHFRHARVVWFRFRVAAWRGTQQVEHRVLVHARDSGDLFE